MLTRKKLEKRTVDPNDCAKLKRLTRKKLEKRTVDPNESAETKRLLSNRYTVDSTESAKKC
jgi:hypothetical protein